MKTKSCVSVLWKSDCDGAQRYGIGGWIGYDLSPKGMELLIRDSRKNGEDPERVELTYHEIRRIPYEAGYEHAFHDDGPGSEVIDIAITAEPGAAERVLEVLRRTIEK